MILYLINPAGSVVAKLEVQNVRKQYPSLRLLREPTRLESTPIVEAGTISLM